MTMKTTSARDALRVVKLQCELIKQAMQTLSQVVEINESEYIKFEDFSAPTGESVEHAIGEIGITLTYLNDQVRKYETYLARFDQRAS